MRNKSIILWVHQLFLLLFVIAVKSNTIDSLKLVLTHEKNDSTKVVLLNQLAWDYSFKNLKLARTYCNKSISVATKINFLKGRSSAYNTLGNISSDEAKNDEALKYYFLALTDKKKISDEKGIATVYNNIGIVYRLLSKYDKAAEYYHLSLNKRKQIDDPKGIADCYNNLGNICREKAQYNEAINYFNQAKEIRLKIPDMRGVAFVLNNISNIYEDKGDFISALKYSYESAKILEKEKDENSLIVVYNNIGILNKILKKFANSIEYSEKSLRLSKKLGNLNYSINCYDNLGNVYFEIRKFENAKRSYSEGLSIALKGGNKDRAGYFYNGLAMCEEQNQIYDTAEFHFKKSIHLAKETGLKKNEVRFSNSLAAFYINRGKFQEAENLLEASIQISKKLDLKNELKNTYKIFANFCENQLHQYAKSIFYHKQYEKLNDSIFSEDVASKFAEAQTKFETEKSQMENQFLKQQVEIKSLQLKSDALLLAKRKNLILSGVLIIFLLVVSGYFFFVLQKNRANNAKIQLIRDTEDSERTRMAKDIHDDIGSGLTKIIWLSRSMAKKSTDDFELKENIQSIHQTSNHLVENMRDLIWAFNKDNLTTEVLISRIREYASDYLADYPIELNLSIDNLIAEKKITAEAYRNIFLILKETLQNVLKHSNASKLNLDLEIDLRELRMKIKDNGNGFSKTIDSKGYGLDNLKARAHQIEALLDIVSIDGSGLTISLIVPMNKISIG